MIGNAPKTLFQQAVEHYQQRGADFIDLVDRHINCPASAQRYAGFTPTEIMLFRKEWSKDPEDPRAPRFDRPYWYISYLLTTVDTPLDSIYRHTPYRLDSIGFCRYESSKPKTLRLYDWDRLAQKVRSHGRYCQSTEAKDKASTASEAATPADSGGPAAD